MLSFHRIPRGLVAGLALAVAPLALAEAPTTPELSAEILKLDTALFDAFNHCDKPGELDKYLAYFAEDVEFYHDNSGLERGVEAQRVGTAKYVCGKFSRELVPESFAVFPLKDYGAISRGVHRFCQFDSGRCEGEADFLVIWHKLEDGTWRVS
ncbi:MAG: nuclear transport factor 2 family protein, partial [Arenimonas sp.]